MEDTDRIRHALVTHINATLASKQYSLSKLASDLGHKSSTALRRSLDPHNSGYGTSIDRLLKILAFIDPGFQLEIRHTDSFSTKVKKSKG